MKAIHSELIKLKYLPIFWLVGFICFCIWGIIFTMHIIDANGAVSLSGSPWLKTINASNGMLSIFVGSPFVILLIGASLYIEHQSLGWKQMYALPKRRSNIILSKLAAILITTFTSLLLIIPGIILCAYLINNLLPEYEFNYYTPPLWEMIKSNLYIFISLLGVMGIQFFLSVRFKGFLIPASFGVIVFIIGLILSTTNKSLALWLPYSYPMVGRDRGMFLTDRVGIEDWGFLTNAEWFSIIVFVVFVSLTLLFESRRNVN